jgi:hypothetical protein
MNQNNSIGSMLGSAVNSAGAQTASIIQMLLGGQTSSRMPFSAGEPVGQKFSASGNYQKDTGTGVRTGFVEVCVMPGTIVHPEPTVRLATDESIILDREYWPEQLKRVAAKLVEIAESEETYSCKVVFEEVCRQHDDQTVGDKLAGVLGGFKLG